MYQVASKIERHLSTVKSDNSVCMSIENNASNDKMFELPSEQYSLANVRKNANVTVPLVDCMPASASETATRGTGNHPNMTGTKYPPSDDRNEGNDFLSNIKRFRMKHVKSHHRSYKYQQCST